MRGVLPAGPAEFLVLDATGLLLLVFRRSVISPLAVGTFQCDDIPHGIASMYVWS